MKTLKLLVAAALAMAATLMPLMVLADVQTDWYSGLKDKKNLTLLSVGDERIWVDDVALPYRFPHSGAVLHSTLGGYRLDLSGVAITGFYWSSGERGIWADGDIAVFLQGQNTIAVDGRDNTGIYSQGSVLVFGDGALSIVSTDGEHYGTGVGAKQNVTIGVGSSVTITGAEKGIDVWDGDILLSLCTVGIYGIDGEAIHSQLGSINVLGSAVSLIAEDGLTARFEHVVIDGSLVDMLVSNRGVDTRSFSATHSYLSWVATGSDALLRSYETYASHKWETAFDNCVVRFSSANAQCMDADIVTLGEGDYAFAASMGHEVEPFASASKEFWSSAILATEVNVRGANVSLCAPGGKGIYAKDDFRMERGRIEVVRSVDVRGMLVFDAALATAYGITSSQIGFSSWSANFYGQVVNDVATNARLSAIDGETLTGVFAPYNYAQSGGTTWCDMARWGIVAAKPVVSGGSYKGEFYTANVNSGEVTKLPSPSSSASDASSGNCMCFIYAVSGKKKYDKVEQSWAGLLPTYYGTQSLYVDEAGKLYFWLSQDALPKLTAKPNSTKYGSVSGSGNYMPGQLVLLKATAKDGYVFTGWFTDAACTKELNPAGYDNRKPTVKYAMPEKATTVYAKFNSVATDKSGLKFSDSTAKLAKTAKAYAANAKVSLALGFSAKSYPKVTATGLPDGLSIDAITGKITGAVKKPGAYTVKVTVTSAAGNKISQNVKIDVKAPSWSTGTFYGYGAVTVNGKFVPVSATFTATEVGKVSGKVIYKGRSASFTADYASATDTEARFTVSFSADGTSFKSAMSIKEKTSGLTYTRAHALKADSFELELQKVVPLVQKGKSLEGMIGKSYTFKYGYENAGLTKSGDKLVVKFADKDVVKLSGIAGGKKLSTLSASVMACGKSKKGGTTKYKLNVPVVAGTVGYYRLLTFKVTIDTATKKVTKVEKAFQKIP